MDQQPQGNFIGFASRYKQAGDKRPNFDGRIAIPGTDREFRCALWAGKDKNNKVMFAGRSSDISSSDSALEQIGAMAGVDSDARKMEENGIELRPGQLVLFTNGYKDAEHPDRPDFYGRWNPGTGEKLVTVSVWAMKSKTNQALLTGKTQYALPGKSVAMEDGTFVNQETGEITDVEAAPSRRSRRGGFAGPAAGR